MRVTWRDRDRRLLVRLLVVATGLVLAGCSYRGTSTELYQPSPTLAVADDRGETIYRRDCAWCHGSEGGGTARGPSVIEGLNGPASIDFYVSTGRMPLNDPSEPAEPSGPSYTPSEIRDIVRYTTTLGAAGPEIPEVHPEEGAIGLGAELYQENCAACHSTTAVGGVLAAESDALARSRIAPGLQEVGSRQITEAMLIGPGTMPVFGAESFDEEDYNSIVAYVEYLQDPDDNGGAPLGHTGPVTEGAVGWIVGLGATLFLIRWIGTRVGEE